MLLVPCRRGGVPCLTPKMLCDILSEDERLVSISVFDAFEHIKALQGTNLPFAAFCGLRDFKVLLSVRSPFIGSHTSTASSEQGIAGDHDTGRLVITVEKLKEIDAAIQPDGIIGLSDAGCVDEPPSKKRRTATDRSCRWHDQLVSSHDELVSKVVVPATVIRNSAKLCVAGTAGVHIDFANQNETFGARLSTIREILQQNPQQFVVSHAESVPAIIGSLLSGVTRIECAVPWQLAAKGKALCLPLNEDSLQKVLSSSVQDRVAVIFDLNDPTYRWDKSPLSSGDVACRCYTCQRHTRCYIHHLLSVQEMNSEILLVIHNLTQIVDLLRFLRSASDPVKHKKLAAQLLALFQV
jgi:queuine tRNA-ribosyltransferase accessory subunit